MSVLANKIDFAVVLSAVNCNPNGDPLTGNQPRLTFDGHGEISDVCIKRKIRNRLQDMGMQIFVQPEENSTDGYRSLRERAESLPAFRGAGRDKAAAQRAACEAWMDVRSFGQLFAFKSPDREGVSIGVRGPVSIHPAISVSPVDVVCTQITKSVNGEPGGKRASDTMGMKYRVSFGLYVFYGSINCQLAERTGFSRQDAEAVHHALDTLFENDASSSRPEGSMEVKRVYWWEHPAKTGLYPSARVHRSLHIEARPGCDTPSCFEDYQITLEPLEGLTPEISEG